MRIRQFQSSAVLYGALALLLARHASGQQAPPGAPTESTVPSNGNSGAAATAPTPSKPPTAAPAAAASSVTTQSSVVVSVPAPDSASKAPTGTVQGTQPTTVTSEPRTTPVPAPAVVGSPAASGLATVAGGETGKAPAPGPAPLDVNDPVAIKGKWSPVLYGYAELDVYHDSTQSFNIGSNYGLNARPGTYRGDHGRTIFDARSTRLGFKFSSPEVHGIRGSGVIETDFWGNQAGPAPQYPNSTGVSEQQLYINPLLRIRHAAVKAETPYVDVLAGLYWNLFGWHLNFIPVSADGYAFPGGAIGRTQQIRLSHVFKTAPLNVEVAVAAARPPQRDAEIPEGQAGIRFVLNDLKGVASFPIFSFPVNAQLGVSAIGREFRLPEHVANPTNVRKGSGRGLSLDIRIPLFGGTPKDRRNAANFWGTFITGKGIGDTYGLTGGANIAPVAPPAAGTATYAQNIDNGIVAWDPVHSKYVPIQWTSYILGGQYHDPITGNLFVAVNYGRAKSNNIKALFPAQSGTGVVGPTGIVPEYEFWNITLGAIVTQSVAFDLGYSVTKQTYADDKEATNERAILRAFYSFY